MRPSHLAHLADEAAMCAIARQAGTICRRMRRIEDIRDQPEWSETLDALEARRDAAPPGRPPPICCLTCRGCRAPPCSAPAPPAAAPDCQAVADVTLPLFKAGVALATEKEAILPNAVPGRAVRVPPTRAFCWRRSRSACPPMPSSPQPILWGCWHDFPRCRRGSGNDPGSRQPYCHRRGCFAGSGPWWIAPAPRALSDAVQASFDWQAARNAGTGSMFITVRVDDIEDDWGRAPLRSASDAKRAGGPRLEAAVAAARRRLYDPKHAREPSGETGDGRKVGRCMRLCGCRDERG